MTRKDKSPPPNGDGKDASASRTNGGAEGGGSLHIPRSVLTLKCLELPNLSTSMDSKDIIAKAKIIDESAEQLLGWVPMVLANRTRREEDLEILLASGETAVELFLQSERTEGTPEYQAAQCTAEAAENLHHYLYEEKTVQWRRAAQLAYVLYSLGYVYNPEARDQFQSFCTFDRQEDIQAILHDLAEKKLLATTADGSGPIRAFGICYKPADSCLNDKSIALIQKKLDETNKAVGQKQKEEARRKGAKLLGMRTITATQFLEGQEGLLAFETNDGVVVLESNDRIVRPLVYEDGDRRRVIAATGKNELFLEEAVRTGATLPLETIGGPKPSISMPFHISWLRFTNHKGRFSDWKSRADGLRQRSTISVSDFLNGKPGIIFLSLPAVQDGSKKWISSGAVLLESKDGEISLKEAIGPIAEATEEIRKEGIFLHLNSIRNKEEPFSPVESEMHRLVNLLWTVVKCGLFEIRCRRVTTLWFLCNKDLEPLLLKERAEVTKREWAEKATVTPQEFFIEQKPGICLVSIEPDSWQDKEKGRRIPHLFMLMERRETAKGYVLALLEVPDHVPPDFLEHCVGKEFADTAKYDDAPVPLKWILQAVYGQTVKADGIVSQAEPAVAATVSGEA